VAGSVKSLTDEVCLETCVERAAIRPPSTAAIAGLHGLCRAHDWPRHRRHDCHLHPHPRGDAAVAASERSFSPVPHRRRQRLLRGRWTAGSLGDVLLSPVRAAESRSARVRGNGRLPGGRGPPQRPPRWDQRRGQAVARRVRDRQLLLDARRPCVRRPRVQCCRRHGGGRAGWRAEPSGVAGGIRRRSVGRRRDVPRAGQSGHDRRHRARGILRRNAARRSARPLAAAEPGARHRRRRRAAAPVGVGVASRHRSPPARRRVIYTPRPTIPTANK